jgi:hypothetical protein
MKKSKLSDVAVLVVLAGLVVIYGVDSVRASTHILNLVLVLPVTVIVLILCVFQFAVEMRRNDEDIGSRDAVKPVLPVMALFAAYVLSLEWLGFDVGTFVFLLAFLWVHGERRWPWLVGYAVSFSSLMALFFSKMLPYPMPMLVLNTVY